MLHIKSPKIDMKERQMIYWLHLLVMWIISISCNSSNYVFKNHTIEFNAPFNPLDYSTCSYPEVVLAFLLYEGSTMHNASNNSSVVFTLLFRLRFSSIPTDKSLTCSRQIQTAVA